MSSSQEEEARALVAVALGKTIDEVPSDGDVNTVPGWDSLAHVRLMLSLEERLRRTLVPEEVVALRSVAAVARALVHDAR